MQIDLNKEIPETFQPLLLDQSRFLILKGSAGAGKSVFVTKKMVFRCLHESMHRFLMLRKVRNTVRESLYEETKKRIYEWKLRNRVYYQENKSELKIWLKDSQFIFNGLDDPERIKSITGITGIVLEEMTEFKEDDFDQVNLRLRGKMPYYKQTIGMFNPIEETHWIKGRFFDNPSKSLDITTHESTYKDNHFLDEEYIQLLESYKETNDMYYQVYCLGNWGVVDKTNKFLFNFEDKHVGGCSLIPDKPVKISFDFNLEPFAAIVYQTDKNNMWVFDKVRLNNSDIHQVCDYIKSNYGQYTLIVTGDRSGYNRSGVVRGKTSYWQEIKRNLNLAQFQIKLRTKNLDLVSSRILCNSALKHKQIIIDPSLKELINDCKYAQVDDKGELIKDRNKNQNDFMDCLRYAIDAHWPEILKRY